MYRVAFVGCTKRKRDGECMAGEMYDPSTLFSLCKQYILQSNYDEWLILSAKYGVLEPETMIQTYDKSLYTMTRNELRAWESRVGGQVFDRLKAIDDDIVVDFYCGEIYRKELVKRLRSMNITINEPLKGLGIGRQMQYLKHLIRNNSIS